MAYPATKDHPQRTAGKIATPEVIDLLAVSPSKVCFGARVKALCLSESLEHKVLRQEVRLLSAGHAVTKNNTHLTSTEEKELATEMLFLRHRFTELVFNSGQFRQAALTIVQNIYLFQNRKIFFGTSDSFSSEQERQAALHLFSAGPGERSLPLAMTFQHLILARVWNRIISLSTERDFHKRVKYIQLRQIVEKLNTIRNIYILLTTGLVKKIAARINNIYKESVSFEDAVQIGSFGIARAAYRYHQSSGVRFSTYAANWVLKEIQRQSLNGRLIRVSTNNIEQYSRAQRNAETPDIDKYLSRIEQATILGEEHSAGGVTDSFIELVPASAKPAKVMEARELCATLMQAIDLLLSDKCADIIKRRYGFPPYQNQEQSVITISQVYGVTRGSIYQLEQTALKKLHLHLQKARSLC